MLNKPSGVFYRGIKPRSEAEWDYSPTEARPTSVLNTGRGFKTISQKACLSGVRTKVETVREDINIQEKQDMPYQYSLYKE